MQTTTLFTTLIVSAILLCTACNDDQDRVEIDVPATYSFERDGRNTVSFSGQTDRIRMAAELTEALKDFEPNSILTDSDRLLEMYRNAMVDGSDADPFADPALNASTKKINNKVAASSDYFSDNVAEAQLYRDLLADNIVAQATEVYPARNTQAEPGIPGQINDGGTARYVNALGVEYDQIVEKTLIGALMTDQILNNYLSTSVLDQGNNRITNDQKTLDGDNPYTSMEHKWDEAYGYLFGNASDTVDPLSELGSSDDFLNKYLARVENDSDFAGIADIIYKAYKRGRAAIVAGDYSERDQQAKILRQEISNVIAIRAVYYMKAAEQEINRGNRIASLHDLSEGIGFIYSLRFTRNIATDQSYFDTTEINNYIDQLLAGDGLWVVSPEVLSDIADSISSRFDFTPEMTIN